MTTVIPFPEEKLTVSPGALKLISGKDAAGLFGVALAGLNVAASVMDDFRGTPCPRQIQQSIVNSTGLAFVALAIMFGFQVEDADGEVRIGLNR